MDTALIFDMDGTLFQTDRILETSLEDTFNYLKSLQLWNKVTPVQEYRQIMGVPIPIVWKTLLPNHSDQIREDANYYFHVQLIHNINANKGALYPDVIELFDFLKKNGFSIFIASNGQTEYLNAIVCLYNLDRWVTETFSIQQMPSQSKNDLVKFIKQKYGISKGAVIGDRLSDIIAAKSNQLYAVGCNFYFAQPEELAQADFIINNFNELIDWLTDKTFFM